MTPNNPQDVPSLNLFNPPDSGQLTGETARLLKGVTKLDPSIIINPVKRSRLTVISGIHYTCRDFQPTSVQTRYARPMDTDEQPFGPRIMKLTEDWVPLEVGWVKECSILLLRNEEGRKWQRIPSPAELYELSLRVVELGIYYEPPQDPAPRDMHSSPRSTPEAMVFPVFEIRPTEAVQGTPINLSRFVVRARHKGARLTVTAFPG